MVTKGYLSQAQLDELCPVVLRQLKRYIVADRKRQIEAAAKAEGSDKQPTGQCGGRQTGSLSVQTAVSKKAPRAAAGKSRAN